MPAARVTIKDIAREVGVSYETVSRALNRRGRVNPETAQRIRDVARRLHYTPNALARGLRVQNTGTLGVIFPCIYENEFYAGIYRGIEEVVIRHEYSIFLCNSDFNPVREASNLASLNSRRVDAIVLCASPSESPTYENAHLIQNVIDGGTPVILVDRVVRGLTTDVVSSDHGGGAVAAVSHLLELGHRRIACVCGPDVSSVQERHEGYRHAFVAHHLTPNPKLTRWIKQADGSDAYGAMMSLLELPLEQRPTAVFCINDLIAMECMRAITDVGLSVPRDISVVGFDDLRMSARLSPALTTVRQDFQAIGAAVAGLFLARIGVQGEKPPFPQAVQVPCPLVVRDSAAPPLALP